MRVGKRGLRIIGWLCIVVGALIAINAVVAGPMAFGGRLTAVTGMALAGAAMVLCGALICLRPQKQ
jgi:hypothetical protein